jgi:hypothetical protein
MAKSPEKSTRNDGSGSLSSSEFTWKVGYIITPRLSVPFAYDYGHPFKRLMIARAENLDALRGARAQVDCEPAATRRPARRLRLLFGVLPRLGGRFRGR